MKIGLSQQQHQTLSPLILQTMELLTLPSLDLIEKLEEEVEKNPVLELEYHKEKEKRTTDADQFEQETVSDIESDSVYQDSSDSGLEPRSKTNKSSSEFDQQGYVENFSGQQFDLYDHLIEQMHFHDFTLPEIEIARLIITSLDSKGFLSIQDSDLLDESSFSPEELESVRQKILNLDPIGIASRNIKEFLLIQIEELYGQDSLEYRLINEFSDLLEKKQYSKIAKHLKLSYQKIEKLVNKIKNLKIYPNSQFQKETTQYIIPDARVQIIDGKIQVILNDEYIPKIKLNQYYIELAHTSKDPNTQSYLKNNLSQAKMLIKNLNSRKEIIFKVILSIVEKQKDFFLKGERFQNPLKLSDISSEIEVHESTVSRAIKEKYIQTDKGILPLKYFFSTEVGNNNTSSNSIKEILKNIIDAEDKNNPLSDEKLSRIFQNRKIKVSRRTIAKYRGILKIPPVYMRKNPV